MPGSDADQIVRSWKMSITLPESPGFIKGEKEKPVAIQGAID
jgi:hypothetical protein